ncbi:MAG: ATP-binding protein [Candidatus Peregrinibacteria bacterium]|nr:ATP-binding protein [Candidatus Peregrinibacteria bacterium]
MRRLQMGIITEDLKKKMVFIVGPRQVGKTYLSQKIAKKFSDVVYLNYDQPKDRKIILEQSWIPSTTVLILDEIHKMNDWKTYIKGVYDTRSEDQVILVTGSARLDTFKKGGDSLAGRFFVHRLLPFSWSEISRLPDCKITFNHLLKRGGFPEPLLASSDEDADRWRKLYVDGLIREDILDFEKIREIRAISFLLRMLQERVGSQLSYSSLARDVGVSTTTIIKYVNILESLFIVFLVYPYHQKVHRSLKKEPRLYFYDQGLVKGDDGVKFENLVGLSLLKHVWDLQDQKGQDIDLKYLRTKDGKEVDFCLVKDGDVQQMIEVKYSNQNIDKNLQYYQKKYGWDAVQVVQELRQERVSKTGILVRDGKKFLKNI